MWLVGRSSGRRQQLVSSAQIRWAATSPPQVLISEDLAPNSLASQEFRWASRWSGFSWQLPLSHSHPPFPDSFSQRANSNYKI